MTTWQEPCQHLQGPKALGTDQAAHPWPLPGQQPVVQQNGHSVSFGILAQHKQGLCHREAASPQQHSEASATPHPPLRKDPETHGQRWPAQECGCNFTGSRGSESLFPSHQTEMNRTGSTATAPANLEPQTALPNSDFSGDSLVGLL